MDSAANISRRARALGAQLTSEQLDDLRDFLDELDLVPLTFLPSEVWPLVYEYQNQLQNDLIKFDDPLIEDMRIKLSRRLAEKRKRCKELQEETLYELY